MSPTAAPLRTLVSFFSGAGGLDLGLTATTGARLALACDVFQPARDTITANNPGVPVVEDMGAITAAEVRAQVGEPIDIVAGGPPCQSYSTAGSRGGVEDPRGSLLGRFVHLAVELDPRYIVIENVRGLLSATEAVDGSDDPTPVRGGVLSNVLTTLHANGYTTSHALYTAADFGAPQARERVIVLAARDGGDVPFLVPTHHDPLRDRGIPHHLPPHRTFRDATAHLTEHEFLTYTPDRARWLSMVPPGGNWRDLPPEEQAAAMGKALSDSAKKSGGRSSFYRRLAWDRPAPTLVTDPCGKSTSLCHPDEVRPLSVQEYAALQGFDPDYVLAGSLRQRYKLLGNAVPTHLSAAVGRAIVAHAQQNTPPEWIDGVRFSHYRPVHLPGID